MSLTATIICLAFISGAVDAPADVELRPAPKAVPSEVVNFDALPPVPQISDDARVKRFIGAFTGGVVGLGSALALMPLANTAGCTGFGCLGFGNVLVGALAPFLAVGGAWLGFEVMGGDGGLVAPAIALGPALLLSLGLLAIARQADADSLIKLMPYLISAGVFLAGGAALALDYRARQINELGAAANWGKATPGRVALTAVVSTLAGVGAAVVSALLFVAGGYSELGVAMMVASGLAGGVGAAAAAWGVHRAMNGHGSFRAALTGLGLGLAAACAGIGLFALAQGGFTSSSVARNTAAMVMATQLGVAAAMFGPALALEWSHTTAIEASLPKISFGASPTPNGGMIAAGMRF